MAAEGAGACKCSPRRPFLSPQPSSQAQAQAARAAARALQLLSYQERVHILEAMADALEEHVHEIVSANQEDVAAFASAREANQAKEGGDAANNALAERLLLTPKKLGDVAKGIRSLGSDGL